jgi:hypothetical protein
MRQWLKNPRVIASLVLIILILEAVGRSLIAVSAAEAVKQGRPVIPSRYGPFLIGLGGGAQPVELKPTAKPGEAQAIESLQGRSLFYLGQANGTIVVYDTTNQHAIYIPTSSAIVEVVNCRTRSEIAACSDAYGR